MPRPCRQEPGAGRNLSGFTSDGIPLLDPQTRWFNKIRIFNCNLPDARPRIESRITTFQASIGPLWTHRVEPGPTNEGPLISESLMSPGHRRCPTERRVTLHRSRIACSLGFWGKEPANVPRRGFNTKLLERRCYQKANHVDNEKLNQRDMQITPRNLERAKLIFRYVVRRPRPQGRWRTCMAPFEDERTH